MALTVLPRLHFDDDPLRVRDPRVESVQAMSDMLERSEISPWTVEMLLMFRLGRPDVLPSTDLGIRKGFMILEGMEAMLPPALHPTLPPIVSWLVYRAISSPWGPFTLAQTRIGCRSGARSLSAARQLSAEGFTTVVDQRAGWVGTRDPFGSVSEAGWPDAGLPVATEAEAGRSWAELREET